MVCNLVTYRARSAVREVGYALGFPRPLVDRVAKALETYDSVMVRRDLEAEGGFAQFFARPGEESQLETPADRVAVRRPRPDRRDGPAEPPARRPFRGGGDRAAPAGPARTRADPAGEAPRGERWLGGDEADRWLRDKIGERSRRAAAGPSARAPRQDEGGPGDSPVSVRWIREGAPSREQERWRDRRRAGHRGPAIPRGSAESGMPVPAPRRFDTAAHGPPDRRPDRARPAHRSPRRHRARRRRRPGRRERRRPALGAGTGRDARGPQQLDHARCRRRPSSDRRHRAPATAARRRSLSDWERWLELCARIDGFPRHLSIHSGGMLVTAAPLIDIAPIERATMKDRVVVQFDKRDVETMKLIKLDLLGPRHARRHRRVRPAHRARLRRVPRPRPDPGGDPRGVRDAPGGGHRRRVPGREPGPDADAAEVAAGRASTTSSWRWRSSGRARSRATPSTRTCAASRAWSPSTYLHPSLEPILHDTLGVILYQEQVMKIAIDVAGFTPAGSDGFRRAMGTWRSTREMEKLHAQFVDGCVGDAGHAAATTPRSCSASAPRSPRSGSRRATRRPSPGPRTSRASSSCSTRRSSWSG